MAKKTTSKRKSTRSKDFAKELQDSAHKVWLAGLGAFAIATERTFARMFGIDPSTGKPGGDPEAFRGMALSIIREFRPTLNLAGIQPILEVNAGAQGWSFYREREIVSSADKDLPLGEQGATRSSSFARFLGSHLDYPPAKIDYLIQGWFGGLGRDTVQTVIDPAMRATGLEKIPGEPLEWRDWLIVRRFLAMNTRSGHEAISRFFDDYEHLQRLNAGLKIRESRPGNEYDDYFERHAAELEAFRYYGRAQRKMGTRFRELRQLYRDRSLAGDELDREISRIYDEIIALARDAHLLKDDLEQE